MRVELSPGTSGLDMRTVSSCELRVTKPDGTTAVWSATLSEQTEHAATARHIFDADGAEVALVGSYVIEPYIMAPGSRRCSVFKLHVVPYPTP